MTAHLFQSLLVGHPETLFLIHHQQTQILEIDVPGKQAVCADHDVHAALLQAAYGGALLRPAGKA